MDTFVLGEVIAGANGRFCRAIHLREDLGSWRYEDDAYMRLSMAGQEICHGGLSATLRDVARFGLFAMDGGAVQGSG